jgi:hypothetical protein
MNLLISMESWDLVMVIDLRLGVGGADGARITRSHICTRPRNLRPILTDQLRHRLGLVW